MTGSYIMRHMRQDDIPQVMDIDREAFPNPWPRRTYEAEIESRRTAQMIVVETASPVPIGSPSALRALVTRWWKPRPSGLIVGYGGCWLISDEAHISTIAVRASYRGKSLGELLLYGMLQRAIHLEADYSVLEVRVSNDPAQTLYRKYEYKTVGRRKRYYRDNGEDALLMEVRPLDDAYQQRLTARATALKKRVHFVDRFTNNQSETRSE